MERFVKKFKGEQWDIGRSWLAPQYTSVVIKTIANELDLEVKRGNILIPDTVQFDERRIVAIAEQIEMNLFGGSAYDPEEHKKIAVRYQRLVYDVLENYYKRSVTINSLFESG